ALTLVACGLMIVSTYFLQPGIEGKFQDEAALSLLLGGIALGGALWLAPRKNNLQTLLPSDTALSPGVTRWWIVGLGVLLLAIVAEISGQEFLTPTLINVSVHLQFGLLVVGILLVGWGLAGEIRLRVSITDRKTTLLLVAIFGIGLVVRVWGLDTTARFIQDETVFTDALSHFWYRSNPGLLNGGGAFPITFIYPYWNALTVDVFGRNLIGLRMASVLLGIWVVPVAYGLARTLFNKRVGLIAALLLATFPPVIHFSQISWGHMGDALFGLLTLMFAARAIKWNRRVDWAFAGVSLGLTQYFFETGRILYPPLIVGWFLLLTLGWRMKAYRRGLVIGVLAAVLIAAPVYYSIAARHAPVTPRMNSSAFGLNYWQNLFDGGLDEGERAEIRTRLTIPFLVYMQHPDTSAEYYGGYEGFVSLPLVPLFLLGVFWLIWRIRTPAGVLVIALLLVSSANIFANDPGFASRYVAFASIIPIVMAVGLCGLLDLLALKRRWLLAGLTAIIALWQIYFYFGVHLPYYNIQRRQMRAEHDIIDAVLRTTDLPATTEVFVIEPAPSIDYYR
ncbi:MAG: glycosyltransferase family 39 protein, partial [Chloroflexota bacterium]